MGVWLASIQLAIWSALLPCCLYCGVGPCAGEFRFKRKEAGSNEWIGCLEVGMLVERFTGHPCRILTLGASEPVRYVRPSSCIATASSDALTIEMMSLAPKTDPACGVTRMERGTER